jgi:hypothetical protein
MRDSARGSAGGAGSLAEVHDHADELREGGGAHFFHHASAVDFHRALADAEVGSHHLVWFTARDHGQDLALARGEGLQTIANDDALVEQIPQCYGVKALGRVRVKQAPLETLE